LGPHLVSLVKTSTDKELIMKSYPFEEKSILYFFVPLFYDLLNRKRGKIMFLWMW
jgi:hypothetical protein